ncbi:MAG: UbiD family decarboxylase [Deltaproteobacteria bacterium]|nr:UbiD family decarboxylase [Deltaproteobacteria bacterium]
MAFNDLREFIQGARGLDDVKEIHGAGWDLEIGALVEIFSFRENFPLLLFDRIPGYPASYRIAANLINHPRRSALAAGLDPRLSKRELVWRWKDLLGKLQPIPPRIVKEGPLFENARDEKSLDMTIFPTPRWHELDGGRYLGTACCVITAEPDNRRSACTFRRAITRASCARNTGSRASRVRWRSPSVRTRSCG